VCGAEWEEQDIFGGDGERTITVKEGACEHWQPGSPNSPGSEGLPSPVKGDGSEREMDEGDILLVEETPE
jgi:hypothetical protein